MLELSATDELIYERFVKEGIFEELNPADIPQTDGAIAVLCSDCDRFHGAMQDLWALSAAWRNKNEPRTHVFALNGGALWLAKDPFSEPIPIDARGDDGAPVNGMEELRFRLIHDGRHVVVRTKAERLMDSMASATLLWHIKQAEQMKGIETLFLNVHAPCGVARHFSWNLETTTARVVAAVDVVRRRVAGEQDLPIVPICRVLRGEREVLRRVNRERFVAWSARR